VDSWGEGGGGCGWLCYGLLYNSRRRLGGGKSSLYRGYAEERGYGEVQILSDVGSGLNEDWKGFLRLLEMVTERIVSRVIAAYGDRLTRFGFETLRRMSQAFETMIEVINSEGKTPREELVKDLIAIVSHFAGKLYGVGSHKCREVVEGVGKLVSG